MADRISVDFKIGQTVFRVSGLAKWFYNDADIRAKTGADLTDEADLTADNVVKSKVEYQRKLVRMVATLARDGVGSGNAAQTRTRQYRFWCHPEFVREATVDLPGKNVDASLLPGNYKITSVFLPVDSNVA